MTSSPSEEEQHFVELVTIPPSNMPTSIAELPKCPVSWQAMTDPVTIPSCGHTFQSSGINQYIQQKREIKRKNSFKKIGCPVCGREIENFELTPNPEFVTNYSLGGSQTAPVNVEECPIFVKPAAVPHAQPLLHAPHQTSTAPMPSTQPQMSASGFMSLLRVNGLDDIEPDSSLVTGINMAPFTASCRQEMINILTTPDVVEYQPKRRSKHLTLVALRFFAKTINGRKELEQQLKDHHKWPADESYLTINKLINAAWNLLTENCHDEHISNLCKRIKEMYANK